MLGEQNLVGRDVEKAVIESLLSGVGQRGGSLLIRGDAGVGKSALLDVARAGAVDHQIRVLRAAGTAFESKLPLGALHQLIRPILRFDTKITAAQRATLNAAFGLTDDPAPDYYRTALAVLDLLAEVAHEQPLLVLADDVQWMDDTSERVLAFVARRIDSDQVILIGSTRSYAGGPLLDGVSTVTDLQPLGDGAASTLLDRTYPRLGFADRAAILRSAEGNPLALLELPKVLHPRGSSDDCFLPLTERLEKSFASRLGELPSTARDLLAVAAVSDSDDLPEIWAATSYLTGCEPDRDVLDEAVSVGLIQLSGGSIHFRHSLIRSAIAQELTDPSRRAAHAALAHVLAHDPERRVWHRAAAVNGYDDVVAGELEDAAQRAERRGAIATSVEALGLAAELTASPADRCRRLFRAGCLSYELGRLDLADRMRREHARLAVHEWDCLDSEWLNELADSALTGGPLRIRALVGLARRARALGEDDQRAEMFVRAAAARCWLVNPEPAAGGLVATAANGTLREASSPRQALVFAFADPVRRAGDVLRLIEAEIGRPHPSTVRHELAQAASCIGAFATAESLFVEVIGDYRGEGRLPLLAQALVLHAWAALRRGMWGTAVPSAEEGARLARETNQPAWLASGLAASAMVEGLRGNVEQAQDLAAQAEGVAGPLRIKVALAVSLLARATAAAGAGEHNRAFECLLRMNDPDDPAHHPVQALWALAALAAAATQCGRTEEARALLAAARSAYSTSSSPAVRMSLAYAEAMLAPAENVDKAFDSALTGDGADWPFERYRASLVYGSWLRRQHRVRESRTHLRLARDGFDQLGSHPWADQARVELRASGERSATPVRGAKDVISPQELQIARMAAAGQTNREIGEKLYLSHRTVGSHLYRLFPKLGITSRNQLTPLMLDGFVEQRA